MSSADVPSISRLANMCAALGTEPRLKIMRLLLAAQPRGMFAGAIHGELGELAGSTLSHHLERLRSAGLLNVRREQTFLWYSANSEALSQLLGFLYEECCTRNHVVDVDDILPVKEDQERRKAR